MYIKQIIWLIISLKYFHVQGNLIEFNNSLSFLFNFFHSFTNLYFWNKLAKKKETFFILWWWVNTSNAMFLLFTYIYIYIQLLFHLALRSLRLFAFYFVVGVLSTFFHSNSWFRICKWFNLINCYFI